ncbi:MAG: acyltransferase [Rhodococcus qingshengii]
MPFWRKLLAVNGYGDVGAGVSIGRNMVIGAGGVVLTDIPDHMVAAGTLARVLRSTPREERPTSPTTRTEWGLIPLRCGMVTRKTEFVERA